MDLKTPRPTRLRDRTPGSAHARVSASGLAGGLVSIALALSPLGAGCGGSSKGAKGGGACSRGELPNCGLACTAPKGDEDPACGPGLNCGEDQKCTAYCTDKSSLLDCGEANVCNDNGICLNGVGGEGGDGDGDGDDSMSGGCAKVNVAARPTTPNVILIVDQSSSMKEDLGGVSRWQALKNVLLGNDGLIAELESQVRFGLYLYSSNDAEIACPALTNVPAKLDNLNDITAVYQPADMIEDTPTGDAINAIVDMLGNSFVDQGGADQTIFILATDGEPDTCAEPDPQRGQEEAIAAVERAFDNKFKTFVIAVSEDNEDGISSGHAQDLANAGSGVAGSPFYRVSNVNELEDSLHQIVSGQLDCVVRLDGTFPEEVATACDAKGTISVTGKELTCDTDWVIVDCSVIEIKGEACTNLKKPNATISAKFACGGIDLL